MTLSQTMIQFEQI